MNFFIMRQNFGRVAVEVKNLLDHLDKLFSLSAENRELRGKNFQVYPEKKKKEWKVVLFDGKK